MKPKPRRSSRPDLAKRMPGRGRGKEVKGAPEQNADALREAEERYQELFERSPIGIYRTTPDGRILMANPALVRMLGYESFAELAERNIEAEGFSPDAPRSQFKERIEGHGQIRGLEARWRKRDGAEVWVREYAQCVRDEAGRVLHYDGTVEDITVHKRTEEALRDSEERFRVLFESSPFGVHLYNLQDDDRLLLVGLNPSASRILGRDYTPQLGRPCEEVFPAVVGTEVPAAYRRVARTGQPWQTEQYDYHDEQINGVFEIRAFQFGKNRVAVMFDDITARRRAEEALRSTEARLFSAMEMARLAYWEYDVADDVFTFNDQFYALFRTTAEKVGGYRMSSAQYARQFVHPDAAVAVGIEIRKALETTDPNYSAQVEGPAIFADGSRAYLSVRISVVMDSQGRTVKLRGANQDITERKLAEERDRQHLKDTALLRDTAVGFIRLAPDADVHQYVADRLTHLVGEACVIVNSYDEDTDQFTVRAVAGVGARLETALKAMGRNPVGTVFTLAPEHRPEYASEKLLRFEDGIRGLSYGKLPRILTQTIEKTFDIGGVYAMGFHWQGRILGTVNIITRRGAEIRDPAVVEAFVNQAAIALQHRRAAEELEGHRTRLEELVAERTRELTTAQELLVLQEKLATVGRVAGSVAHELRNPLGAIRNASFYLQMTVAPKLEGKPLRHLQIIEEHVERANQAITMILDFTQGRSAEPDLYSLHPILQRAVKEASVPPTVEVLIAIPPSLPQVRVDAAQVTVVFRNLVTNAVQAMPDGGTVKIQARAVQDEVVVDVTDAGVGIKPEHIASLFRPLFTTKDIGVGLGLAICREFIRANKGTISVVSEVGKGTTFTVTLPTAEGQTLNRRPL